MLKGELKSGFKFEIEDSRLNNFELLEVLSEVDANPLLLPKLLKMLLGDEQKKALLDHLRDKNGMVPSKGVSEAVMEIFQTEKVKNS